MNVPQLIAEVRRQVPEDAPVGTRGKASAWQTGAAGRIEVAVAARIDPKGRRREQFWCNRVRVPLPVLLRLTCPEAECPHAQQVRAQWAAFRGRAARPAAAGEAQPLMREQPLQWGGQDFIARPARFPSYTQCPNGAHPPLTIHKTGYDLFSEGRCVGGGVVQEAGHQRPRLPTLQAAEAFVFARQLQARAAIAAARASARRAADAAGDEG